MAAPREPQDHRPRVRKSTQAEIDQTVAVVAEVDAEADDGYVLAELCGEELQVLPPGQWRQSTNVALQEGRLNDWALTALTPESYDRWLELDPTNDEALAFFEDYGRKSGNGLGDSRLSVASSRSTRRQ